MVKELKNVGTAPLYLTTEPARRTEREIIQEIHDAFDFDLMAAFAETFGTERHLKKYKPPGMSDADFGLTVEHYAQHYPGQNFVSERQVEEICKKYGLVTGPAMLFTADIPQRNREEIARFRLRDQDVWYKDPKTFQRWMNDYMFNSVRNIWSNSPAFDDGRNSAIILEAEYCAANMEIQNAIMPVGDGFILIGDHEKDGEYKLYAKLDVHGSEWFVYFGNVSVWTGHVRIDWQSKFGGDVWKPNGRSAMRVEHFCRVSLRLGMRDLEGMNALNLATNVSPQIVAPGTMFERFSDALEVRHGYRLRMRSTPTPRYQPTYHETAGVSDTRNRQQSRTTAADRAFLQHTFSLMPVDDPIVLQPVPGGYLVVTKWGLEATIPEIQNPKTN